MEMSERPLGRTGIRVSPIGLGCWQFGGGGSLAGGYWPPMRDDTVVEIVRASLEGGIDWFDTAEAYGRGKSEAALSRALETLGLEPGSVRIATKWLPVLRRDQVVTESTFRGGRPWRW